MDPAPAQHVGARLLGEIEEESLDELITALRASFSNRTSRPPLPFPTLSSIVSRYQQATKSAPPPLLSLSGRYLPFLYHLVSTLIAAPHRYAIVVVDADHRFDVTRLLCQAGTKEQKSYPATQDDLKHLYVYRPARSPAAVKAALAASSDFMIYGSHASRDHAWWGTVVVGGPGGDVNASWKGWLEVRREDVAGFGVGMSAEEALGEREKRQVMVKERGWEAFAGGGRLGIYRWYG